MIATLYAIAMGVLILYGTNLLWLALGGTVTGSVRAVGSLRDLRLHGVLMATGGRNNFV